MKSNEPIESNCPECGKRTLVLREKDIYCKHCQKAILHKIPGSPEGEHEVIKASEKYIKEA